MLIIQLEDNKMLISLLSKHRVYDSTMLDIQVKPVSTDSAIALKSVVR